METTLPTNEKLEQTFKERDVKSDDIAGKVEVLFELTKVTNVDFGIQEFPMADGTSIGGLSKEGMQKGYHRQLPAELLIAVYGDLYEMYLETDSL